MILYFTIYHGYHLPLRPYTFTVDLHNSNIISYPVSQHAIPKVREGPFKSTTIFIHFKSFSSLNQRNDRVCFQRVNPQLHANSYMIIRRLVFHLVQPQIQVLITIAHSSADHTLAKMCLKDTTTAKRSRFNKRATDANATHDNYQYRLKPQKPVCVSGRYT